MNKRLISTGAVWLVLITGLFSEVVYIPNNGVTNNIESIYDSKIITTKVSASFSGFGNYFTENKGQVEDDSVLYYLHGSVAFTKNSVIFNLPESKSITHKNSFDLNIDMNNNVRGIVFLIHFENSNDVIPIGSNILPHRSNYFLGNDSTKWRTNIANYESIIYPNIYDGIDLIYRIKDGYLKYDFVIYPNGNPDEISVTYECIEGLTIKSDGSLIIKTAFGELFDTKPYIFQELMNTNIEVTGTFKIINERSIRFEIQDSYNRNLPLIIDPGLELSTFIGGSGSEEGESITLDSVGNVYITGHTSSSNFPTTAGAYNISYSGQEDVYIVKFNNNLSSLLYSTFIGGNKMDVDCSIVLDPSGNAYITGHTKSTDFPTTEGAYDEEFNGEDDIFIAKLNNTGSAMLYSTFIGGLKYDFISPGTSIALDSTGNVYVSGWTSSFDFPTTPGAYDTSFSSNASFDIFIVKINYNLSSLLYSTFLGGIYYEQSSSLALDSMGNVYVTGYTHAEDFPTTTGAYNTTPNGGNDVFVTKLNSKGSALLYSTLLGGNEGDYGTCIVVDSIGNAYITGGTQSSNFPITTGAYNTSFNGEEDVFITKLNCTGNTLLYSTFIGGDNQDSGYGIAIDDIGNAYISGYTYSSNFPFTIDAYDDTINGTIDAFFVILNSAGSELLYSTFYGGTDLDLGFTITLTPTWDVYIIGNTRSPDFPTTPSAYNTTFNGGTDDVFVVKFGLILSDFPPLIEAWEPGGTKGQTFFQGEIISIMWSASDNKTLPSNPINISYGNLEIGWTTISTNEANDGEYLWNTSTVPFGTYWVSLSVYDSGGQTVFDLSNYSFDISDNPPTIETWEPGGSPGQNFTQEDVITITWTADDDRPLPSNPINITYGDSINGWTTISTNEANDGEYLWDASVVPCGTYWMNITVYDSEGQTTFDVSNYCFNIVNNPPVIEAFEPGGSPTQIYTKGDVITITWAAGDDRPLPGNPINITHGNSTIGWVTIATDEANDGTYGWDTSSVPCGTYWVNISVYDSIGQTTFDVCNYSFKIVYPIYYSPVIDDVKAYPDSQTAGEKVTLSATVRDDDTDLVDLTVTANITKPDGTTLGNFTMTYNLSGKYTYTDEFNMEGTYTFIIWVGDPESNWAKEDGAFVIEPKSEPQEYNWKPIIALIFATILLILGILVSYKRPIRFTGILKKDRWTTFLAGVLLLVIAEAFTGIISLFTGLLSVPPILGGGMIVDLIILIIGLISSVVIFIKGKISMTPEGAHPILPIPPEEEFPSSPLKEEISPPPEDELPPPPPRASVEMVNNGSDIHFSWSEPESRYTDY